VKTSAVKAEKIRVLSANNLKPPQFNGKKGDSYLMWKMKFETDMVMKGLHDTFQPELEAELPTKEKVEFDLTDKTEKKQHDAVVMNLKAIMQFVLLFSTVPLLNKLNCKKRKDKTNWPSGKAHHVVIMTEFEPEDTMAEMEMERALAKLKLGPKKDPNELLDEFASIECQYLLELSKSKKKVQVLRLGGTQYSSIISTTSMINRKKGATLMIEKLLDEMYLQWRHAGGKSKDDKDSNDKEEITLAATNAKKGGKKSNGREKKENPNKVKTCNHCKKKGHIKNTCWEKFPDKKPKSFKSRGGK
jgi:hypothetical protein